MDEREREALNAISSQIIGAAIEIHSSLGPGLLESVYRTCLIHELNASGLAVSSEQIVPVCYKNLVLEGGYRLDLLVENRIIVELKSVERLTSIHRKQVQTYLRLANLSVGLLINFAGELLRGNTERIVVGEAPDLRTSPSNPK